MRVLKHFRSFIRAPKGNVSVIFAFALLPFMFTIGSAVDYSRAVMTQSQLQSALDSAVLAGEAQPADSQITVATNVLNAAVANDGGILNPPTFTQQQDGSLLGKATVTIKTSFMQLASISSLNIGVNATAALAPATQNACVVTEANGMPTSQSAFTINGGPSMNLQGCGIQSNASMSCNGHSGGASVSMAAGSVSGCSNPQPAAPNFSDIFKPLASNIVQKCGSNVAGLTWTAGVLPPQGDNFYVVNNGSYDEYHVCGKLTLSGSGALLSPSQQGSAGAVIVVENGGISVSGNVSTSTTAFVLTGTNGTSLDGIAFANGSGSTLAMSPPTSLTNPWHGIALYIDPALTTGVDANFGPGESLNFDGVVYMPNTNLTFHGNTSSGEGACSQLIVNSFTADGNASLNLQQSTSSCQALGVTQAPGMIYLRS